MLITVGRNLRCAVAFVPVEPYKGRHVVPNARPPFPATFNRAEGERRVRDTSVVSFPAASDFYIYGVRRCMEWENLLAKNGMNNIFIIFQFNFKLTECLQVYERLTTSYYVSRI